jgi:cadmium resistance protein CadD (predicted permease)
MLYGSKKYTASEIMSGQYAGLGILLLLSFLISLLGYIIDPRLIGLLGFFPIYLAVKQFIALFNKNNEDNKITSSSGKSGFLSIAVVTIANGGDNIGVYVPLLSAFKWIAKFQLMIVFAIMVYLWCGSAKYLSEHPWMARPLNKYGHILVPMVLLCLGLFILYYSRSMTLFLND